MEEAAHAQRLTGNSAQHLGLAAPAWQPWIAKTQMDRLERAQNQALRRITGQTASSPVEALRIEADLPSYETVSRQLIATSRRSDVLRATRDTSLSKANRDTGSAATAGARAARG